jgi:hypothetical protein
MENSNDNLLSHTLVIKIEEIITHTKNEKDNIIFIIFDKSKEKFIITGKRDDTKVKSCNYYFECKEEKHVFEFLALLFGNYNNIIYTTWCNIILYNYNKLDNDNNNINFELLQNNCSSYNELVGYNLVKFEYELIFRILSNLRNVLNYNK